VTRCVSLDGKDPLTVGPELFETSVYKDTVAGIAELGKTGILRILVEKSMCIRLSEEKSGVAVAEAATVVLSMQRRNLSRKLRP
jgi:hypothetical protein